jgi:hypothetical protein
MIAHAAGRLAPRCSGRHPGELANGLASAAEHQWLRSSAQAGGASELISRYALALARTRAWTCRSAGMTPTTKACYIFSAVLLLMLRGAWQASGCSLISIPPVEVNPDEAVFSGRVVGMVEHGQGGPALWGIRVTVLESILSPGGLVEEYIVFPFFLGSDCSKSPVPKDWLQKEYPLGASVWVVGSRFESDDSGRLWETWEGSGSYIARNSTRPVATARTMFDYRDNPNALLAEFELRKDLLRLKQSRTPREKERILQRLAFYHGFKEHEDRFRYLVERHLEDKVAVAELMRFYTRKVRRGA